MFLRRLCRDLITKTRRSSQWRKVRRAHVAREGACAACGSREKLEVHHIVPVHLAPDLELHEDNLITLCESRLAGVNCHFHFGHEGDWHGYNTDVRHDAATFRQRFRRIYDAST